MTRRAALAAGLALLLAVNGCMTSRRITTRQELAKLPDRSPITVYARDDRVVRLTVYGLEEASIRGWGTLSQRGEQTSFSGSIPFEEIIAVKTQSRSVILTLAVAGVTVLAVSHLGGGTRTGLTASENVAYHGPTGDGTSSCPYIYAWNGARYELQAEPFGIAWGRGLELTTTHLVPAARAQDGLVRLRLTNERAEIHYVNSIRMRAIDPGGAPGVVLDGEGRAWPLWQPMAPLIARDEADRDILPAVSSADGRMWECDPSRLTAASGYESLVELAFARPRQASTGSLVLTGINTTLSATAYAYLCRIAGEQTALLAHAVETDPEMISLLRDYTRDASLDVLVWDGRRWERAGSFAPEANGVTFTRALRVRVPEGAGETVRVRLRSMADVWKLDRIAVDWRDVEPLPGPVVETIAANGPGGEDLRGTLGAGDRSYAILLPPDRVELAFRAASNPRTVYAVEARGYLMEWEPVRPAERPAVAVPEERRIEFLKSLLKERDLVLEPIYAEWRKDRRR